METLVVCLRQTIRISVVAIPSVSIGLEFMLRVVDDLKSVLLADRCTDLLDQEPSRLADRFAFPD